MINIRSELFFISKTVIILIKECSWYSVLCYNVHIKMFLTCNIYVFLLLMLSEFICCVCRIQNLISRLLHSVNVTCQKLGELIQKSLFCYRILFHLVIMTSHLKENNLVQFPIIPYIHFIWTQMDSWAIVNHTTSSYFIVVW